MKNFIKKTDARLLLKGVSREQFIENFRDYESIKGSKSYRQISEVVKSTDKAIFISAPTHPECKEGFWMPKSVCKFEIDEHYSDNSLIRISIQFPYSFTPQGKDEVKNSGISVANALANFITKTGGDVYCNA